MSTVEELGLVPGPSRTTQELCKYAKIATNITVRRDVVEDEGTGRTVFDCATQETVVTISPKVRKLIGSAPLVDITFPDEQAREIDGANTLEMNLWSARVQGNATAEAMFMHLAENCAKRCKKANTSCSARDRIGDNARQLKYKS